MKRLRITILSVAALALFVVFGPRDVLRADELTPTAAAIRSTSPADGDRSGASPTKEGSLEGPASAGIGDFEEPRWTFSIAAYSYFVPDDRDYVQPTITADRGWLHLEARYNYEDLATGSAWVGWNLSGGEQLPWEFCPMLGGVFGNTAGIAPGYKGSLGWWKLELYSEGECVIDARDTEESFFYNWSELTLAPVDWFRFGVVTQRTRAYEADRDIQRGLLVGFTVGKLDFTTCVFNPDQSKPLVAMAVSVSF